MTTIYLFDKNLHPTPPLGEFGKMRGKQKSASITANSRYKGHGNIQHIAQGVPCFLTIKGDVEKMARYLCEDTGCSLYDALYAMLAECVTANVYEATQARIFGMLKARHGAQYDERARRDALPSLHSRRHAIEAAEAADALEKSKANAQCKKSRAKKKAANMGA